MAVTNGEILTYLREMGEKKCVQFLSEKNPNELKPSLRSYELSIKKLTKDMKYIKRSSERSNDSKYELFLNSNYSFPQHCANKCSPKVTCSESLDLNSSVREMKKQSVELCHKVSDIMVKLDEKEDQIIDCQKQLSKKDEKIVDCQKKLKRTLAGEKYNSNKVRILEKNNKGECCDENKLKIALLKKKLLDKDKEINELKDCIHCNEKEINELKDSITYLEDIINDNSNDKVFVFNDKSKTYTAKLKSCVYEILNLQVSASKVSAVIESVLKLVDLTANKLPCRSTVLDMSLHRLYIAQAHINEVFAIDESTVLMTDETSKYGDKYMGYEASDSKGALWVLGLRDIETKSASDTLKVFKQILEDLDEISCQEGNETSKNIVSHIVATMSDRAATEVKFNNLLHQFRKDVLPLTYLNYNSFTEAEKSALENMCNFFCGLHALVNFAEASRLCIKEIERSMFDGNAIVLSKHEYDSDPGVIRLVREASKAFGVGSGGDQKSGCQGNFKNFARDFLVEQQLRSVPLRSYRGTRFNILFSNAAAVYFMHSIMIDYLEKFGAGNKLLQSVLQGLKTPELVAGLKALGLISKLVTCPLWSLLEDKQVSITDMNVKYLEVVTFLEDCSKNIQAFMKGEMLIFGECTTIDKDVIYTSLVTANEYDAMVEVFLQTLLPTLCTLSRKLFADHLPGGKLIAISNEMKEKLKNAPKTSCFAESVFGQLDHLLRTKPNISTLAAEASIMFLNNNTTDWLNSKNEKEKLELIKKASKSVKKKRNTYKIRLSEIQERRRLAIQEKIQKNEVARQEKIKQQEEFTKQIINHGLWQTESEVDNMLLSYNSETAKMNALKAQLRFRKNVLNQIPSDKTLFNFSKNHQDFSQEELTKNLKELVSQAIVGDSNSVKHILVGKRVRHRFQKDGQSQWYHGKVISQVPSFPAWFNIIYDDDPSVYTYHRLDSDEENADLQILV